MTSEEKPEPKEPINFDLSEEDLEAIAQNQSKVVPNLPTNERTPFTIENAPMAKSIMPAHFMAPPPDTLLDPFESTDEVEPGEDEQGQQRLT